MASNGSVIMWFRQDLRLRDNPALKAAAESGLPVLAVYILDDENADEWCMGEASRWWLHQSLSALDSDLDGKLNFFCGKADEILNEVTDQENVSAVYWNRCYEPWRRERDRAIRDSLLERDIEVSITNGSLLFQPQSITKDDGTPYKVFTPYYKRGCLENGEPPRKPQRRRTPEDLRESGLAVPLEKLGLMPDIDWYDSIDKEWSPGERGARAKLDRFLESAVLDYKDGRNRPDQQNVSRLSPHLHFGEISPHQVWHAANDRIENAALKKNIEHFKSELGWREFSYYILYHSPDLPRKNLQKKFDRFPWRSDKSALKRWQKGQTGYPIVDAGMRELWQTGYMHNRVRMIVASFLVKNLLLHWHQGEEWFWDTLVDADLANNSASWQWVAGSGADAAPYFRIFNPVTQGNKFDPNGDYVRQYVPEIADLPDKYLHSPWEAPDDALADAGVRLGKDYPKPMVDLKESRERALAAFKKISGG